MKAQRISTIIIAVSLAWATGTSAGELSIVGNVSVGSNLTANVTTLRGATNLASAVLDFAQPGLFYRYTLTNDATWVFTNHVAGRQVWLQVAQDDTGGWQNLWPADVLWPNNGGAPNCSTAPNRFSVFKILDNGNNWLAQTEGLDYRVPCVTNCNFALQFDGNQNSVSVPDSTDFALDQFTIEFWSKTDVTPHGYNIIWMGNFSWSDQKGFYIMYHDGGDAYPVFTLGGNLVYFEGGPSLGDGLWHHVAVTYDGDSVVLFVDGTNVASMTASGSLDLTGRELLIGGNYVNSTFYNGSMDEVRISNVALYTDTFTPSCDLTNVVGSTVALWKFNEGSNTTAHDSSGNSHTGTLQGTPNPAWVDGAECGAGGQMNMAQGSGGSRLSSRSSSSMSLSVTNSPITSSSMTITDTLGRVWGLLP